MKAEAAGPGREGCRLAGVEGARALGGGQDVTGKRDGA